MIHQVVFAGYINDLPNLMSLFDVFVLPSLQEAASLACIEAMSLAKPIIGTSVGGIPEQVYDNVNGFIVEPRNPQQIANSLIQLIENPSLREKFAKNSYLRYREYFDSEVMVQKKLWSCTKKPLIYDYFVDITFKLLHMRRSPLLTYDRGTLILHPPPKGKAWIDFATWDDRVEKFRIPAHQYRSLIESLEENQINFIDDAKEFSTLDIEANLTLTPYAHQQEALEAWKKSPKTRGCRLAHRRRENILGTNGDRLYSSHYLDISTHPRLDAPMVCPNGKRLS